MKHLLTLWVIAIAVVGCRSSVVQHPTVAVAQYPVDAEAVGMKPVMQPTQAQSEQFERKAWDAFGVILGKPLPDTIRSEGPTTGWYSKSGKPGQLRAGFKLPRGEFYKRLPLMLWREIPIPKEYYEPMHLPRNAPKSYMTCNVGQVKGKPAYLFWSDYSEGGMLVLDY